MVGLLWRERSHRDYRHTSIIACPCDRTRKWSGGRVQVCSAFRPIQPRRGGGGADVGRGCLHRPGRGSVLLARVGYLEFPCAASSDAASRVGAGEERTWGGDACIALGGRTLLPRPYASQAARDGILPRNLPLQGPAILDTFPTVMCDRDPDITAESVFLLIIIYRMVTLLFGSSLTQMRRNKQVSCNVFM